MAMNLNILNKKKLCILGGTFNPIHIGHLFLAEAAYDYIRPDFVLIMPSLIPPHKEYENIPDARQRAEMVKLAIKDNPHLKFSDFEMQLEGPSYTSRTLQEFHHRNPEYKLYLILGGDSLYSVENWKDPEVIFRNASILTGKRENETLGASGSCKPTNNENNGCNQTDLSLNDKLNSHISYLRDKYNAEIINLNIPNIEVSSSEIIRKIKAKESIKYYTPDSVIDYIYNNNLFR